MHVSGSRAEVQTTTNEQVTNSTLNITPFPSESMSFPHDSGINFSDCSVSSPGSANQSSYETSAEQHSTTPSILATTSSTTKASTSTPLRPTAPFTESTSFLASSPNTDQDKSIKMDAASNSTTFKNELPGSPILPAQIPHFQPLPATSRNSNDSNDMNFLYSQYFQDPSFFQQPMQNPNVFSNTGTPDQKPNLLSLPSNSPKFEPPQKKRKTDQREY